MNGSQHDTPGDSLGDGEPHDVLAGGPQPRRRSRLIAWSTVGVLAAAAVAGGGYAATIGGGSATASSAGTAASGSGVVAPAEVAAAATTSPSTSPVKPVKPHLRNGPRHPGLLGPHWGPGLGRILHGEVTVTTKDGGTRLIDVQRGTVTAVNGNSLTVTSSDKTKLTYVMNAKTRVVDFALAKPRLATVANLKVGDTVRLLATRSGDTRTATAVLDGKPKPPPGAQQTASPNA